MLALHGPLSAKGSVASVAAVFEHARVQIPQKLHRQPKRSLANLTHTDLQAPLGRCMPHAMQQNVADAFCAPHTPERSAAPVQRRHLLQHMLLAAAASALSVVGKFAHMLVDSVHLPQPLFVCSSTSTSRSY